MPTTTADKHKQRRQVALRMKRDGLTFREIGDHFDVTKQRAKQMCDQAYREEYEAFKANRDDAKLQPCG